MRAYLNYRAREACRRKSRLPVRIPGVFFFFSFRFDPQNHEGIIVSQNLSLSGRPHFSDPFSEFLRLILVYGGFCLIAKLKFKVDPNRPATGFSLDIERTLDDIAARG
jgi:hypothetical protein